MQEKTAFWYLGSIILTLLILGFKPAH